MSEGTINFGKSPEIYTYQKTGELRWYSHSQADCVIGNILFAGNFATKTLQQAWICIETGEKKWEDIPCVVGEEKEP